MTEFFIGSYLLLSGLGASFIAKSKNRSTNHWYTLGIIFGILAVIAVLIVPKLEPEDG
jgi:uncharacterized membrane protein HdeD (DUF308 family)